MSIDRTTPPQSAQPGPLFFPLPPGSILRQYLVVPSSPVSPAVPPIFPVAEPPPVEPTDQSSPRLLAGSLEGRLGQLGLCILPKESASLF
jgi:hypothetical protein